MARFEDTCKTNTEILKAIFINGKSGDKKEYIMQKRVESVKVNKNYTYTISITTSVGNGNCNFLFTGEYNDPKVEKDNVSIYKYIGNESKFFAFLNDHFSEKKLLQSQSESVIPTKAQVKEAWGNESGKTVNRPAAAAAARPVSAPARQAPRVEVGQSEVEQSEVEKAEAANKAAVDVLNASKEADRNRKAADKAAAEKSEKERLERVEKERLEKERKADKEKERLEKERLENERLENERLENERLEKQKAETTKTTYLSKFMTLLRKAEKERNLETIEKMKTFKSSKPYIFNVPEKTTPVKDLSSQNSELEKLLEQLNKNPNAPPPPAAPPAEKAKPSAIKKGDVVIKVPPLPPPGSGFVPAGAYKVTTTVPPKPKQTVGFNAPRNDSRIIYFYGNYEPEGAIIELSKPVDLASVLKLRIAEGKWIHYNYQSKENTGNLSRTAQITNKYPYLHLNLTQTADGKWIVRGEIHPIDDDKKYYIKEGELPPKNKGGRVGGSKMGRSTVLGRIMSIIRGSIKHVTRKKGRKPRSKTRRYKNKSQKKEKNKLNITKKVRFNRNKI